MGNNAKDIFGQKIWKKKSKVIGIFIIFAVILGIGLYVAGYRLTSNFTLGKKGVVLLQIPLSGTSIFVNESEKIVTSKDNETVTLSFSPRTQSVIVARDGYFPWKKDFTVSSGKTLTLYPLLVSQNASGMIITIHDPEYVSIKNLILKHLPPTKENPLTSTDESTTLWLEDNTILIKNKNSTTSSAQIVIQPDTIIKNVDFYKNRKDVVIFSTGNSIYALETDDTGGQNFLPIYKGQNPNFVKQSSASLYVLDGENLMEVII